MKSPSKNVEYMPLEKASRTLEISGSFPHMKDAYWLGVSFRVTEEAQRRGIKMQPVEAGGYTELDNQISQIDDCVSAGAKAVMIGAIPFDGLDNAVTEIRAKSSPVNDRISGMSSPQLSAKSSVSFGEMGRKAGAFLAVQHCSRAIYCAR